jgi:hypothetical protein
MLTLTNYMEWALVMQINLEASLLWEAVEGFPMSVPNDKASLGAILCSVPPEMVGTLVMTKWRRRRGSPSRQCVLAWIA